MSQGHYRALNILLLIGATTILVVARSFDPDPNGVGTHLQLGLQPCIFLASWGIPCPACGWTTSFALMADGRVIAAFINQPFGVIMTLITITLVIISACEAIKPRERWLMLHGCFRGKEVKVLAAFFVVMVAAWAYKIVLNVIFLSATP